MRPAWLPAVRTYAEGDCGDCKGSRRACQVSMEERMGCGIGACLVCACALKSENGETRYGHVCKDGPVFNAEEVEW